MELLAVITALKEIQGRRFPSEVLEKAKEDRHLLGLPIRRCRVYTAMATWPRNGWMTSAGPPVENVEQWKTFVREYKKLNKIKRVKIKWERASRRRIRR